MISVSNILLMLISCAAGLLPVSVPDRPRLTPEELLATSSVAVIGSVVHVYTHEDTTNPSEKVTLCIAEIAVEEVVKGDVVQRGDRLYAKYYHVKWMGEGPVPPGWSGQRGAPAGARAKVYLHGSKNVFRVVEPNGFSFATKQTKLKEDDLKILKSRFRKLGYDSYFNKFVYGVETKRVLVIHDLTKSIERGLKTLTKDDSKKREDLSGQIDDLDSLDGGEYEKQIESFRKQIGEISGQGG